MARVRAGKGGHRGFNRVTWSSSFGAASPGPWRRLGTLVVPPTSDLAFRWADSEEAQEIWRHAVDLATNRRALVQAESQRPGRAGEAPLPALFRQRGARSPDQLRGLPYGARPVPARVSPESGAGHPGRARQTTGVPDGRSRHHRPRRPHRLGRGPEADHATIGDLDIDFRTHQARRGSRRVEFTSDKKLRTTPIISVETVL